MKLNRLTILKFNVTITIKTDKFYGPCYKDARKLNKCTYAN
jgi:hypothetical protein